MTFTQWGLQFRLSAALNNAMPDGTALPSALYLILIDSSFAFDDIDTSIENVSEITGVLSPTNYAANTLTRAAATWTISYNSTTTPTRAEAELTTAPRVTLSSDLENVQGFAICTENSSTTGKVMFISAFNQTITTLLSSQSIDIPSGKLFDANSS